MGYDKLVERVTPPDDVAVVVAADPDADADVDAKRPDIGPELPNPDPEAAEPDDPPEPVPPAPAPDEAMISPTLDGDALGVLLWDLRLAPAPAPAPVPAPKLGPRPITGTSHSEPVVTIPP